MLYIRKWSIVVKLGYLLEVLQQVMCPNWSCSLLTTMQPTQSLEAIFGKCFFFTVLKLWKCHHKTVVLLLIWLPLNLVGFPVSRYSNYIFWNATSMSENTGVADTLQRKKVLVLQFYYPYVLERTFIEGLPTSTLHIVQPFWAIHRYAPLQKLSYEWSFSIPCK